MNSTKQNKRKKSLRKRIITTMVICILVPFLILTIALVLQLLSNIDEFITNAMPPGSYDYLEAFKIPIIITFIIIAAVIIFVIISAVIRISRRITLPIIELNDSVSNIRSISLVAKSISTAPIAQPRDAIKAKVIALNIIKEFGFKFLFVLLLP